MYNEKGSVPETPPGAATLPSGEWVVFRDPESVTERQRRRFELVMVGVKDAAPEALEDGGMLTGTSAEGEVQIDRERMFQLITKDTLGALNSLADVSVAITIREWSLQAEVSEDTLLDLTPHDYHFLQEASIEPFKACFLDTSPADPADTTTPTTP